MARRAAHGTDSGYQKHRALGQQPCVRCCDAHNQANRRRWRARTPSRVAFLPGYFHADDPSAYLDARLGNEPAEALTTADRARLVAELHGAGWSDEQIAAHTRMTPYTTARIRDRLELEANPEANRPAAAS